jgi:predicted transcriptional regulator
VEKTTLYLPAELRRSLHAMAKRRRRSQADLIREALTEYLGRADRPTLSSIGIGEDDEVSGATSEDYLRSQWGGG